MSDSKEISQADCVAMDGKDELKMIRDRFIIPENLIYLDGNSLGPLPRDLSSRMQTVIEKEWGVDLIRGWIENDWLGRQFSTGDRISEIIGGGEGNTLVCDSTSINLFKALGAALKLRPGRSVIISEVGNFPTDLYIMQGMIALLGDGYELKLIEPGQLQEALNENVAAVCLTHVNFKTGKMWDMAGVTSTVHQAGALMLWDLAHSAGAVELDLLDCEVDIAFGCGYKFLNGGPGAPSFIFVHPNLQNSAQNPIWGWFGHARPFAFEQKYDPMEGVGRFVCGTPQVLSLCSLSIALDVWAGVNMSAVRAKSVALCELFISLVETRCADFCESKTLVLVSPRDAGVRGSQVSFSHPEGYAIMQALIARNVIGDFRAPDVMRFGFTPLYLGFQDVWKAVEHLRDILDSEAWNCTEFKQKKKIT